MDSMILIGSVVLVLILAIVAILLSVGGGKKKRKVKKKKGSHAKNAVEIDPETLCNKMFKLAPSELKEAKAKYVGRAVEVRTILGSSNRSKRGSDYREVVLDFQDNRNFHILGDIKMSDYKDQSWMTREGKLKVVGNVKEINPKEIILDNMKVL